MDTFTTYRLLSRDMSRTLQIKQKEPDIARETKYYQENIKNIKSLDDFMKDTRIYNYAVKAFGLEEMAYAKAYMRKVLEEGVTDKKSFANRLNDARFVNFATAFDFKTNGDKTTSSTAVQKDVVDKYLQQSLEEDEGAQNEGVRLALYFKRMAPTATSAYSLLGDPALWKVVQTVFSLPAGMAATDVDRQGEVVKRLIDVKDLQDPAKLDRFIQRFTAMWDATENASSDPVLLLFSNTTSSGFSDSLINLKYGG